MPNHGEYNVISYAVSIVKVAMAVI